MRIAVVGSGYVGLVTAACLADTGNHVVAADADDEKVKRLSDGHVPIFEPGLEELVQANLEAGRLRFTTDTKAAADGARVVFLAVGTPPNSDGSSDLSNIEAAARDVAHGLSGPTVVAVKSTVPVGTSRRLGGLMSEQAAHPVAVVSNPEFLKEGRAVEDFLRPDRVVIGSDDAEAADLVTELHRPFVRNNRPILRMSLEAAEMTKYAANAYLAMRISFINEMAELCERFGVDIDEVRCGIGADARIGYHFLYPGVGYGGSCLPKDVQALVQVAGDVGADLEMCAAAHRRNVRQRERLVQRIVERLDGDLSGKRLAVWGLAFKPETDDVREAPAITIVQRLLAAGASVTVHDPRALQTARAVLGEKVTYCCNAYDALRNADALVICTEWMEYRSPDFDAIRAALSRPLIFDGRNIYDPRVMQRYGFEYHSVGRPSVYSNG